MNIQDTMKKSFFNFTSTSSSFKQQSTAQDLKARLEWGKPALTILDVRERIFFNQSHITGAMSMPMDELVDRARSSISLERDLYVYGASEEDTSQAANALRAAGFENVAELKGGLEAWKSIAGPTDGSIQDTHLDASAYNIVARLSHHFKIQKLAFNHK